MINVGAKVPTHRRAVAQGRITLAPSAYNAVVTGTNPKGDVLAIAEIAGILSAKAVPTFLPLCHPLPIEQVLVSFTLEPATFSILAFCEVQVTAKTGAEMEALAGVNGALLCVYDLSKAVDPVLSISDIRLNVKEGGKSGVWTHPQHAAENGADGAKAQAANATGAPPATNATSLAGIDAFVITISDRASRSETEDKSGPALSQGLEKLGAHVTAKDLVADDRAAIQNAFKKAALSKARVIISTGGTGLSPRDITPEALQEIGEKEVPGFGEALRADGAKHIYSAYLSRSVAVTYQDKLMIALPGSPKAVVEALDVLAPLLKHALHTLKGGDHAVR